MLLSELTDDQKGHLAWRLDHYTGCGYLTACAVARGDHGDMDILDILRKYGSMNTRRAKSHATKICQFELGRKPKTQMRRDQSVTEELFCKEYPNLHLVVMTDTPHARIVTDLKTPAEVYAALTTDRCANFQMFFNLEDIKDELKEVYDFIEGKIFVTSL